MKKLVKKLALSCFALAACALTLVSTTYAWYTTNTEVEATDISGASADTGAASVFVSADGGSTWYQKVSATASDSSKIQISAQDLSPVAIDNGTWVDSLGNTVSSPKVLSFTLAFKTAPTENDVLLGIKAVTVKNTTASTITVDNLIDGTTYSQDILPSLAVQMISSTESNLANTGYSLAPGVGCSTLVTGATAYTNTNTPDLNAHDYCNEVVPGSVTYTTAASVLSSGLQIATLPKSGTQYATVTFNIYLDGANTLCYDACKGQTFVVNFEFNVIEP